MPRNRSAGIVIKDDKVLVMHRINHGDEYWVFPGGGVEVGETPEQAAVREIAEETSLIVSSQKLLYHITWDTGEENFFYLCEYHGGEPYLPEHSEEYEQSKGGMQVYEPLWIDIKELHNYKLYQLEIRDLFIADYVDNFSRLLQSQVPQELFIEKEKRRHV